MDNQEMNLNARVDVFAVKSPYLAAVGADSAQRLFGVLSQRARDSAGSSIRSRIFVFALL